MTPTSGSSIAVVTGANRGLGLALSRRLVAQGTRVWMGARDLSLGQQAAAALGPQAQAFALDVTDASSVTAAADMIADREGRLDVLINNAGVFPRHDEDPQTQTPQALSDTLMVNVTGVHTVTQAFFPLLKTGSAPVVVNVSSGYGSLEWNSQWDTTALAYCTSKAALNMLSLQWWHVLRPHGIALCMPSPGWMTTPMGRPDGKSPDQGAAIVLAVAQRARQSGQPLFMGESGVIPW